MRFIISLTLLLLIYGTELFSYPISPRPLRKLIAESEYIVIARVNKIKQTKTNKWRNTQAVLEIKEVLQGNIRSDKIYVPFSQGMICPAPAHYAESTDVMAFLKKNKGGKFSTHALSYGSKTLDSIGMELYKQRVLEMQKILEIKSKEKRDLMTLDWLIKCASHNETRWEGVYELSPQSDFMSYYDRSKDTYTAKYELTLFQKNRLRSILFKTDNLSYNDLGLADLVVRGADTELTEFLIIQIRKARPDKIWFNQYVMQRIAILTNREDLFDILERMEIVEFHDKKREEKMMGFHKEFVELL